MMSPKHHLPHEDLERLAALRHLRGGPPFGPGPLFGHPFGGGRGRARRGEVRVALLTLLADEPRNGYQLMQAIEERSGGRWRPSPGSVYPALAQLEDQGFIRATERDGTKLFEITDAGREHVSGLADDAAPWDTEHESGAGQFVELRSLMMQTGQAARQVAQVGDEDQMKRALELLAEHAAGSTGSLPRSRMSEGLRARESRIDGGAHTPAPAIVVAGLAKNFGEVKAVRGVDFEVAGGEVFGFLGPNGAGKTTTINMLCTLMKPTAGSATVAGHDVVSERDDVRRNIGLVFQDPTLDGYLSAVQNLKLHAELYGLQRDLVAARMRQVLEMVGLWERKDSAVGTFSGGMRRRLEIARGIMHSPRVLFLDEPTIGLDPQTRRSIWSYIRELKEREEITIFMTTHYMDEAEWCDRIAIMDHGQIVALDAPETLKAGVGKDRVMIHTDDDEAAIEALAGRFGIEARIAEGAVTFGVPSGEQFVPRLFAELGVTIQAVSVSRPSLDDVFMSFTGTTIRDAEEDASKNRNRMMLQMMHGGRR